MQKLLAFVRRRPLLTCSLLANAVLATGWMIERHDREQQLEDFFQQTWRSEGSYVRLLGDWDDAVQSGDEERIAELSFLASRFAEARELNARTFVRHGFAWAD